MSIQLLFPHQLFQHLPFSNQEDEIYLVEEFLFFKQYAFHQQKIAFHRASMKAYADYLEKEGRTVIYIEAQDELADIRHLIPALAQKGQEQIAYIDPTDNWLEKRLRQAAKQAEVELEQFPSPLFLNEPADLQDFFKPDKKKYFQTKFYIAERKKRSILLDASGDPVGGKWSFDSDNRKKYPRKKTPPAIHWPADNAHYQEAKKYVAKHFADCPGSLSDTPWYPTDFAAAEKWLTQFLEYRFAEFGPYEDAIVAEESILHHGLLTPLLNVGLLRPQQILDAALDFAQDHDIAINTIEGFVRQIIGWREFIRGMYECRGSYERTRNFWAFDRKIPASFYTGTTGIDPIDKTIKKVLKTGYCHHIERLMVLGNFMVLCEFDPDEVYRWFMELFIDAYDWVMVPNVYGMSQFADGGLMATKPYISGSNYLMKMSDYPKGDWQNVWDALFWSFMDRHRDFFLKNPRLGMLVHTFDKMSEEKRSDLLERGAAYLATLDE